MGRTRTGIAIDNKGITVTVAGFSGKSITLLDSRNDAVELDLNDSAQIRERVAAVLSRKDVSRGPVSISLPDTLARVALLDFEELPRKDVDVAGLISAKAAKMFAIDQNEYRFDSQVFKSGAAHRSITLAVKAGLVDPLESALAAAGIKKTGIGIHSLHIANLVLPEGDENGVLLVRCRDFIVVIIFRAGVPDFYRCKAVGNRNDLAAREAAVSFAFYADRNPGVEMGNVYVYDETASMISHLAEFLKRPIVPVGSTLADAGKSLPIGGLPALGASFTHA